MTGNISVKPTHLGLDLGIELCRINILQILRIAEEHNNFLRIDMEDSPHTDATLELYRNCLDRYPKVGTVLQAYLFRSAADLSGLMNGPLNFRLCKGIYSESPGIAIQDRTAINDNFVALARQALEGGAYLAIATHDLALIPRLEELIRELEVPVDRFEFQVLLGVPMKGKLEELRDRGYKVRVYVPFGESWYDYSVRRLKENPNLAGNVLKNLLRRKKA